MSWNLNRRGNPGGSRIIDGRRHDGISEEALRREFRKLIIGWRAAHLDFAGQRHSVGYAKLCQQGRDVKLHGALRHVQVLGDFLVGAMLENVVQHFLLAAADFHSGAQGASRCKKLLGALDNQMMRRFPRHNHQFVVFGRLAAHQAMHGEQAGDFFYRKAAIGLGLHSKSDGAGGTFAKNKALGLDGRLLKGHSNGCFFSAYQSSPHSFQSVPGWQTNFD